jgi:hypothetical protein
MSETTKNRVQGMVRSIDQYRNGDPKVIMAGPHAQALYYALTDARHDVLALWSFAESSVAEITRLTAEVDRLTREKEQEPVGEAGPMPGSNGGFTMAAFKASDVPSGTKLYASPQASEPAPQVVGVQERVATAHHALFHDDPTDIEERVARFYEEVNETCQALGMSREDAHELVDYTYGRPTGEADKEVGAARLTLASLCVVADIDLMERAEAELEKLQRPETIARIRAKRASRHGRGPLPGLDPALASQEKKG